jgi:hypothetical protein
MGYKGDEPKAYNKKYYEQNKAAITEAISKREQCKLCGRTVRHDNMFRHVKTLSCISRQPVSIVDPQTRIDAMMRKVNEVYLKSKFQELYLKN